MSATGPEWRTTNERRATFSLARNEREKAGEVGIGKFASARERKSKTFVQKNCKIR